MKTNTAETFWSRVDKTDTCWIWTMGLNGRGYAIAYLNGQKYAHRLAWELTFGPIPAGKDILHKCDNPKCVKPDHLWLGTHQDNMADRDAKGRLAYGERMGPAKLKWSEVEEIRRLYRRGEFGRRSIARLFGISPQYVADLVKLKWRTRIG